MKLKKLLYEAIDPEEETSGCLTDDDNYSVFDFLKMIRDLNETEKDILLKKIACKCTDAEIAEDLYMPESIVKSKYYDILSKLLEKLPENEKLM